MEHKPKILLILTGGTICSQENPNGKRYSNAGDIKITEDFHNGNSPYANKVDFDKAMPLDILSENMTVESWNTLLTELKNTDFSLYKGIIILHGTDTLAYTSAMLSMTLGGLCVPVIMVSAQLPLSHKNTNGHQNFRTAVELIMGGIAPNVYAVYKNSDKKIYLHQGAHLEQCKNFSDDFFSRSRKNISDPAIACMYGREFEKNTQYLDKISSFSDSVLLITPYVGINYDRFSLEGVKAVIHTTFHSESVCVGDKLPLPHSVLSLIDRCKERDIPLFLAPCSFDAYKYESTGEALKYGAYYIESTTLEAAYAKVMVAVALGLDKEQMRVFVNESVNWETINV